MSADITKCAAWAKLVEHAEKVSPGDYRNDHTLQWIQERAAHYAERTGLSAVAIFESWERNRTYWFMNFYQDCYQPLLGAKVRIFETSDDLNASIENRGFRCCQCGGVTTSPSVCNSGIMVGQHVCRWNSQGLFGTLGKGVDIFVKAATVRNSNGEPAQGHMFMPIAWENHAELG